MTFDLIPIFFIFSEPARCGEDAGAGEDEDDGVSGAAGVSGDGDNFPPVPVILPGDVVRLADACSSLLPSTNVLPLLADSGGGVVRVLPLHEDPVPLQSTTVPPVLPGGVVRLGILSFGSVSFSTVLVLVLRLQCEDGEDEEEEREEEDDETGVEEEEEQSCGCGDGDGSISLLPDVVPVLPRVPSWLLCAVVRHQVPPVPPPEQGAVVRHAGGALPKQGVNMFPCGPPWLLWLPVPHHAEFTDQLSCTVA